MMLCAPTPIWRPLFNKLTRSSLADPSPISSFLKNLDLFHPLAMENVILKVFGTFSSLPKMTSLSLEGQTPFVALSERSARLLGRAANTSDVIAKQSATGPPSSLGTRLYSIHRSLLKFVKMFCYNKKYMKNKNFNRVVSELLVSQRLKTGEV